MTRVLLVEDDEVYGPALCRALERSGMLPTLATSVAQGLERAKESWALAVVDLRLPDGSGADLVPDLVRRGVKVVMLTGHGSIPAAVECMRAGATDFLTKPVSTQELVTALQAALQTVDPEEAGPPPSGEADTTRLYELERAHILGVLQACDGNISEAARRLGLYRRTLQRKLQKLGPG